MIPALQGTQEGDKYLGNPAAIRHFVSGLLLENTIYKWNFSPREKCFHISHPRLVQLICLDFY